MANLNDLVKEYKSALALQNNGKNREVALVKYHHLLSEIYRHIEANRELPPNLPIEEIVTKYRTCLEESNSTKTAASASGPFAGFSKYAVSFAGLAGVLAGIGFGTIAYLNNSNHGEHEFSRQQFETSIKDEKKLEILTDIFRHSYIGVTPDKVQTPPPWFSEELVQSYLRQLVDGEATQADKEKGIIANPELVSIKTGMEGQWPKITIEYTTKNSDTNPNFMNKKETQQFYFDPNAGQLYLIGFVKVMNE